MRKQKKLIKILSFLVIIMVLVLLVLLVFDFSFFEFVHKLFRSSEQVSISDNCGVVLGNLIHEIKNEDNCIIRCRNECGLRDESFVKVEFSDKAVPCYECNCFCR